MSRRSSTKLRRRYRELDGTCWEINNDDDVLVATTKDDQQRSSNKRTLKLEKKLLNRACQEADLVRQQRILPVTAGIKQSESVTGVFSSVIIELTRNSLHCLAQRD